MKRTGLTLIEVIIILVVCTIIGLIVFPSLKKKKVGHSEYAGVSALKTLNGMFATYKKKGYSYTGKKYPHAVPTSAGTGVTNAGTFSGLYYEVNSAGEMVTLIGASEAGADLRADGNTDKKEGNGYYTPSINGTDSDFLPPVYFSCQPRGGYWFALFNGMTGTGGPYKYDMNEARNHYGLQAIPAEYGSTGENIFIINEEGTVYSIDMGGDAYIQWYPTVIPGIRNWEIAE